MSGTRASRPKFDKAVAALEESDTLVVTTLDRLGGSTLNMLAFAEALRDVGAAGGEPGRGRCRHAHPHGFHGLHGDDRPGQRELEIKRERITDSVAKPRAASQDLSGRRQSFTDSQIRSAARLVDSDQPADQPASQVARDLGMSRATLYRRIRELPTPTT